VPGRSLSVIKKIPFSSIEEIEHENVEVFVVVLSAFCSFAFCSLSSIEQIVVIIAQLCSFVMADLSRSKTSSHLCASDLLMLASVLASRLLDVFLAFSVDGGNSHMSDLFN
jgi:hypothetical protein